MHKSTLAQLSGLNVDCTKKSLDSHRTTLY